MKKNFGIFAALFATILVAEACDDGPIPRKEYTSTATGLTAKLTATITGTANWPDYYQIALAAFGSDSEYSLSQVQISADTTNAVFTLSNLDDDAETIELCVTNRLRKRILTFQSADVADAVNDTVFLEAGTIDAAMFATIQTNIFNKQCTQCHGGSTSAAANLYLTEGLSYDYLVNQPSTQVDTGIRVIPGNADESILPKVINEGNILNFDYNHEYLITDDALLRLIDEWIDNNAHED